MNRIKETRRLIDVYSEIGYTFVRNEPIKTTFEKALSGDSFSSYVIGRVLISWMGELDPSDRDEAWQLGIDWLTKVVDSCPQQPGYHEAMVCLRQYYDPAMIPSPEVEPWYHKDETRYEYYLDMLIMENPAYILCKAVTIIGEEGRFDEALEMIRNYYRKYEDQDLRNYSGDINRTESNAAFLGNVLISKGYREDAYHCWVIASRLFDGTNMSNYTYALFYNLAWCYGYGEIVEKDLEKGREYFEKALWIADRIRIRATDPDNLKDLYGMK